MRSNSPFWGRPVKTAMPFSSEAAEVYAVLSFSTLLTSVNTAPLSGSEFSSLTITESVTSCSANAGKANASNKVMPAIMPSRPFNI